ncbi:MAG: restriction endonuclease subunit S, partial [Chitinophagaceae bacterium]
SYPAITSEDLLSIEVKTPPLKEQQAIGWFLDKKCDSIDGFIEKKLRLIELLQEEKTALINHAVTKGIDAGAPMKPSNAEWLGDIPAHWEVVRLKRVTSLITNGYVGPTRDILKPEGVRYIQSLHIKGGTIKFHTPYYVSADWSSQHSRSILKEHDILVVQTGAVGSVGIVSKDFEGCNCHALIILRINNERAVPSYVFNVLQSNYGFHVLKSIETGALHPHLNSTIICDIELPLPTIDEQIEIANLITLNTMRIEAAIGRIEKEIELLEEYKQALISEVVTGKVKVEEPVEEPEAVL